jgi:FAD/FMN-containing dehydrogenase
MEGYVQDWLGQYRGEGSAVLRPKTTEECSAVLKYCNDNRIAVNLQGGNTGLVGGSVPVFDEVVISTELMREVISLDEISGILSCQVSLNLMRSATLIRLLPCSVTVVCGAWCVLRVARGV